MYKKDAENVTIFRIRFNNYARTIHTQYRGVKDGKQVGWSEQEQIKTDKEWFKRLLKGK